MIRMANRVTHLGSDTFPQNLDDGERSNKLSYAMAMSV